MGKEMGYRRPGELCLRRTSYSVPAKAVKIVMPASGPLTKL